MDDIVADPFAPPDSTLALLATRLGCTEGQLYSIVIGLVLAFVVSAGALPQVIWRRSAALATPPAAAALPIASPPVAAVASPPVIASRPAAPTFVPPSPAPVPPGVTPSEPAASPPSTPVSAVPAPIAVGPLRLVDAGYAAADPTTPQATFGVPAGSFSVGVRLGRDDRVGYIRVAGVDGPLVLRLEPAGVNVLAAQTTLRLCPVLVTGWRVGNGDVAIDEAPAYDCASGVDGLIDLTGSEWTFDLAGLTTAGTDGFAVLASAGPLATTQVVLQGEGTP